MLFEANTERTKDMNGNHEIYIIAFWNNINLLNESLDLAGKKNIFALAFTEHDENYLPVS